MNSSQCASAPAVVPDYRAAASFVSNWCREWNPDWWLNLCTISQTGGPPTARCWQACQIASSQDEIATWIANENRSRRNVYFTYNPLKWEVRSKPKKSDLAAVVALGVDIDPLDDGRSYAERHNAILEVADRIGKPDHDPTYGVVVLSGNGIGAFVLLPCAIGADQIELAERTCAYLHKGFEGVAKIDGTWNADRLMRLPETYNWPNQKKIASGYPAEPRHARISTCTMSRLSDEEWSSICNDIKNLPSGATSATAVRMGAQPPIEAAMPENDDASVATWTSELLAHWAEIQSAQSVEQLGPDLREKLDATALTNPTLAKRLLGVSEGLADNSRSGFLMSLVALLKAASFSITETAQVLSASPHCGLNDTTKYRSPDAAARAVARAWANTKRPRLDSQLPPNFEMTEKGLYFAPPATAKIPDPDRVWLIDHHTIIGECADAGGQNHGIVISWNDKTDKPKSYIVDRAALHREFTSVPAALESHGLHCKSTNQAHSLLRSYFNEMRPSRRMTVVDRGGWHGGSFILPDGVVIGPETAPFILRPEAVVRDKSTATAGTLDEWKRSVAQFAIGNDRLVMGICLSFAGPLLALINRVESGGVHLVGKSRAGKTSVLKCAASVWGDSKGGRIRQWRATANGLEGIAAASSDMILILDELGQAKPDDVGDIVYMLANGAGKQRADRTGAARSLRTWRTMLLSSGETTVEERLRQVGRGAPAGLHVRLVNIPADAGADMGVFQNLHGFGSAAELAEHLGKMSQTFFGTAIRPYLSFLEESRRTEGSALFDMIDEVQRKFVSQYVPNDADGQVRTVAMRFGLIAGAGNIATELGILPWEEDEAFRACAGCFAAWLSTRGNVNAAEDEQALAQVRQFIMAHGESRFEDIHGDSGRIISRIGWKRRNSEGECEYLIQHDQWRQEVCRGLNPQLAAKVLRERGFLKCDNDGLQTKETIPGEGRIRVYVVYGRLLGT